MILTAVIGSLLAGIVIFYMATADALYLFEYALPFDGA